MKTLKNIKKAVFEVAQILASDETIVKLLVNDNNNALNEPAPSIDLNTLISEHYVCIVPPVESGIRDSWRNTFITILLDTVNFGRRDDNTTGNLILYVTTDEAHAVLVDNKLRTLELIERILTLLEGKKLSSAGELSVSMVSHTMLSEFRPAYRISINFTDQNTRKVEI